MLNDSGRREGSIFASASVWTIKLLPSFKLLTKLFKICLRLFPKAARASAKKFLVCSLWSLVKNLGSDLGIILINAESTFGTGRKLFLEIFLTILASA